VRRTLTPDLCIIGAGAAGLSIAAVAGRLGARVVLIEAARTGGECLHSGCVPSKALLAAGAKGLGFAAAYAEMRAAIARLAPQDSPERLEALGVEVIQAEARFIDPRTVEAGEAIIRARHFVLATGSRPALPPIPGLAEGPYLTNETLFERAPAPTHLLVLGGGPMGAEMAQAYRRLGAAVTLIQASRLLPRDDAELAGVVAHRLAQEGVRLIEGAKAIRVDWTDEGVALELSGAGAPVRVEGSHVLVAAGRRAHLGGLGLEAAGIAATEAGITVDARLRTTNRRVFAAGDAAGGYRLTHMASHHAGVVIRNALFRLPAKVDHRVVPWVTYTEPELMQVGLNETAARAAFGRIEILRHPFAETDRAAIEGAEEGLVKLIATPAGRLIGGGAVGKSAGELALPLSLMIGRRLPLSALATAIVPYPTRAEALARAAGRHYAPRLFTSRMRRLVRLLARLP
jgi:pyruvate/2-oxoglutarate dehydrogenase complex dihydrolipoamide dehydrogenase (E3) component